MRAVQCTCSAVLREGGFLGFFADVYQCEALIIKSEEIVYLDDLQKKANLRIKVTIKDDYGKYSSDSILYVPVEHCDAEGMFKSIQSVIKQFEQVERNLLEKDPELKLEDLNRTIRFLSEIKKEKIFVSESATFTVKQ